MQVYERGKYWWAWGYYEDGKRWFASTKVPVDQSKRTAEAAGKRIERDRLVRGQAATVLTVLEALSMLKAQKERAGRSEATMDYMRGKSRQLLRVLGPACDVATIDPAVCDRYVDQRMREGVGQYTAGKELGVLFEALRVAKRHGLWEGDTKTLATEGMRGAYVPRERWLTVPEYQALILAMYQGRREHVTAYVYLGVRHSELYRIHARHLDHDARRVFVDGTKSKRAKRWIPCAPEVWDVLERRAADKPTGPLFEKWQRQNMRQLLHRACLKADVEPVSANDLRRTFASWLCSAGVPEMVCARLMGHTTSAMVRKVYAQMSDEAMGAAIARMPRTEPGKGTANG